MTRSSIRSSILKFTACLFAAVLPLAASSAYAQSPRSIAVVNVPFAFQMGAGHLASGTYTISMIGENALSIRGKTNSAMASTRYNLDATASRQAKVVFHRYGDQYFLREVWTGQNGHLENPETKGEARLRKARNIELAANHETAPRVDVAVLATVK